MPEDFDGHMLAVRTACDMVRVTTEPGSAGSNSQVLSGQRVPKRQG